MTTTDSNPDTQANSATRAEFERAKAAATEAYNSFLDAKMHLRAAARTAGVDLREGASEQLQESLARLNERKRQTLDDAGAYIRENPLMSAGIAFVGGMLFSRFLIK
ncbi:MAG: hypothetical protein LBF16_15165 [Pseudomonadales bacterium]|jgi:ElaB/YqjD/DUF883 family membrane-anchored ribosome-binding protein|nr:hypothetical protein [Pseudomonadales bacterium]